MDSCGYLWKQRFANGNSSRRLLCYNLLRQRICGREGGEGEGEGKGEGKGEGEGKGGVEGEEGVNFFPILIKEKIMLENHMNSLIFSLREIIFFSLYYC